VRRHHDQFRHPEAKERMMRSFAIGVAERHRANAFTPPTETMPAAEAVRHEPDDAASPPNQSREDKPGTIPSGKTADQVVAPAMSATQNSIATNSAGSGILDDFLSVADGISQALAGENLQQYNQQMVKLRTAVPATIPLGQIAKIRRVLGPSEISSENGRLRQKKMG
jgi:hypothetical protein